MRISETKVGTKVLSCAMALCMAAALTPSVALAAVTPVECEKYVSAYPEGQTYSNGEKQSDGSYSFKDITCDDQNEAGLCVFANGATAKATVDGGIVTEENGAGLWAGAKNGGEASAEVSGSVSAKEGPGVYLIAEPDDDGNTGKRTVSASVSGSVTSEGRTGAALVAFSASPVGMSLSVGGDLSGARAGLAINSIVGNAESKFDVLVEGTIAAKGTGEDSCAVIIDKGNSAVDVTAWRLQAASDDKLVNDDAVAKTINYIIRVNGAAAKEKSSGNVTAAGENKTVKHGFNTAVEGEKVFLTAADGYEVVSATQGGVALSKEGGKYFYVVTRGGGIDIQATVEAISAVYKVVFQNEDGTVLQTTEEKEGATPAYKGETPTKAADDDYTYAFDAWTPTISKVTKDVTYTATYTKTAKEKPAPSPEEPAAETKAVASSTGSSNALPATGDTAPVIPAIATLLLAAAAIGASRAKLQPFREGKHARR